MVFFLLRLPCELSMYIIHCFLTSHFLLQGRLHFQLAPARFSGPLLLSVAVSCASQCLSGHQRWDHQHLEPDQQQQISLPPQHPQKQTMLRAAAAQAARAFSQGSAASRSAVGQNVQQFRAMGEFAAAHPASAVADAGVAGGVA